MVETMGGWPIFTGTPGARRSMSPNNLVVGSETRDQNPVGAIGPESWAKCAVGGGDCAEGCVGGCVEAAIPWWHRKRRRGKGWFRVEAAGGGLWRVQARRGRVSLPAPSIGFHVCLGIVRFIQRIP